jgi:hypothetical protein
MRTPEARDIGMVVFAVAVLALATPLRVLWLRDAGAWWIPFAVWCGIIVLGSVAVLREGA